MTESIQAAIAGIIPFILAVSFHEAAHAFVADRLGDSTAKDMGRLTLNPIVHADMMGTVIFPMVGLMMGGFLFGWAKPVPVAQRNLRWKKYGMLAVAAAGPAINILLALIFSIGLVCYVKFAPQDFYLFRPFLEMLKAGVFINVILAVFNLIPLPPLDGSRIVEPFLSYEFKNRLQPFAGYSFVILLLLVFSGALGYVFHPVLGATQSFLIFLTRVI